jgi:hypothetical protein
MRIDLGLKADEAAMASAVDMHHLLPAKTAPEGAVSLAYSASL